MNFSPDHFFEQQKYTNEWVLRTDTLIDGVGNIITRPIIHIRGDRIAGIKSAEFLSTDEIPCLTILNSTAIPGLIDCHFHALGDPVFSIAPWDKDPRDDLLNTSAGILNQALGEGITTLYDCGAPKRIMVELMRAIEEHIVSGPQVLTCNQVIFKGKHAANGLGLGIESFENLHSRIGTAVSGGANFINVLLHGTSSHDHRFWNCQFDLVELKEIVKISHSFAKKVTVQCFTQESFTLSLAAAVDIIEIASPLALAAEGHEIQKNRWDLSGETVLIPSLSQIFADEGKDFPEAVDGRTDTERIRDEFTQQLTLLLQQGAGICAGSNDRSFQEGTVSLKQEILHLAKLTGSNMQAISNATGNAARLMKLDHDQGILAEGLKANLLIVAANPLEDINALNQVYLVIKDGRIVVNNLEKEERRYENSGNRNCYEVNPIHIYPNREEKR